MRINTLLGASLLACALAGTSAARAAEPEVLATTGRDSILACATCHGADGGGVGTVPRLAGMNAAYLQKQLGDYESGSRMNGVMQPIAKALTAEERAGISGYYAAMPIPPAKAGQAPPHTDPDSPGASLALRGKWSAGVPACVQCHGPGGIGVGDAFPAIAGQPATYIADQLRAWQAGTRKNDPIELMRHLSANLDESEIRAVSEWFALQPAASPGDSR